MLLLLGGAGACGKSGRTIDVNDGPDAGTSRADAGGKLGDDSGSGAAGDASTDAARGGESGSGGASGGGGRAAQGGGDTGSAGTGGTDSNPERDAGPPPDRSCETADANSELSVPAVFSDEAGFALTPGVTGFGVAYRGMDCGAIGTLPVAALGAYMAPGTLFGDCSGVIQDVSLVRVSNGFRVVWIDNSAGSLELQTMLVSDALKAPGEPVRTRLTTNELRELRPTLSTLNDAPYLAWIAGDGEQREIALQRLDQGSEAQLIIAADEGRRPTRLALAQLGAARGVLGFVDEQAQPGIWIVPLDESGQRAGDAVRLSEQVSTGNSIDIATREQDGGGVVYSIDVGQTQPEVRFRRLNAQAGFLGDEIKIVSAPDSARDASIARLGDGYVVAYRLLPEADATRGEIRLAFITKEGHVMRDTVGRMYSHFVTDASPTGGRITARVSVDGQLLIGFLDSSSEQGLQFRLIRKRLDCAL